ncbi:MAG: hypothetical protein QMD08_08345 [Actinomycetota bacterium]|nr:hypothetical protein [Actinomycetota bacterium]
MEGKMEGSDLPRGPFDLKRGFLVLFAIGLFFLPPALKSSKTTHHHSAERPARPANVSRGTSRSAHSSSFTVQKGMELVSPVEDDVAKKEREELIRQIDEHLKGSPMEGKGRYMVEEAERHGFPDPTLCPSIARQEGQCGERIPPGSFNSYGITAAKGEPSVRCGDCEGHVVHFRKYESWEDSIKGFYLFVLERWGPVSSPYEMKDYCGKNSKKWAQNIASIQESIRNR